ncbi:hypothetical protein ONZ45_g1040 [Pleurotus djamor]|nr:hypothetical protein ONZ45_g1040 [Pleurotus djamor]
MKRDHVSVSSPFLGDDPAELEKRDGSKYVFIHHMVGNTFPYTQADWEDDIRQIQAKGVDGIALNIGSSDWQRGQVASAYAAAAAVRSTLKLFISFDFTEMPCNIDDVVARTNQWANNPYQFKVNGKTMISTFSGDCFGNSGWQTIKDRTNGYLMPFIWGLEGQFNNWPSLDSWMCWGCAWPQGNYVKNTDDDNYYISQLGSRYAATISPWFYTHYDYKNYLLNSDAWLLVTRWEQLMSLRSTISFVELVSWNDYGESHHLGPVKGAMPSGTNWVNGLPHSAWFDLCEYYIKAFQTGSYPAITKDVIYYWARTHPAAATASGDPLPRPKGWDWVEDSLWVVVFATSSGSVTLKSGSNQQTFSINAGVTKLKLPLAPGKITVSMTKNSQVVINSTPSDFTFITNPVTYNFNPYVGSAAATSSPVTSTSASSTTVSSTSTRPSSSSTTSSSTITSSSSTTTSSTTSSSSSSSSTPTPTPTGYTYLGCYADPSEARVLNGGMTSSSSQSVASCVASCASRGFSYAGTEYGTECAAPRSGRDWRIPFVLHLFSSTHILVFQHILDALLYNPIFHYVVYFHDKADMTPERCQSLCTGYDYSGVEYGTECYCGNSYNNNGATGATISESSCNSNCGGDSSKKCGGAWTMSLYTSRASPPSTQWTNLGCYTDASTRLLRGSSQSNSQMTNEKCISYCSSLNFVYAATEFGSQCYDCGNQLQKEGNAGNSVSASECNNACAGDSTQKCGAAWRANLFKSPNTP